MTCFLQYKYIKLVVWWKLETSWPCVTIVLDYLKLAVLKVTNIYSRTVLFQIPFDPTIIKYPEMYSTIEKPGTTSGFLRSHTGPSCLALSLSFSLSLSPYILSYILNISEIHNILKPVPSYEQTWNKNAIGTVIKDTRRHRAVAETEEKPLLYLFNHIIHESVCQFWLFTQKMFQCLRC